MYGKRNYLMLTQGRQKEVKKGKAKKKKQEKRREEN